MKNTRNNASLQPVRHRLKLPLGWPLDRRFRLTNDSRGCAQLVFESDLAIGKQVFGTRSMHIYLRLLFLLFLCR